MRRSPHLPALALVLVLLLSTVGPAIAVTDGGSSATVDSPPEQVLKTSTGDLTDDTLDNTTDTVNETTDSTTNTTDSTTDTVNETTDSTTDSTTDTVNETTDSTTDTVDDTTDSVDETTDSTTDTVENETTDTSVETTPAVEDGDVTVDVRVAHAEANETVVVDISPPESANRSRVEMDELAITPTVAGTFTLNVTTSDDRLSTTPGFSRHAAPLGYVHVDHSIRDENISAVNFTYRVSKDALKASGTEPEDVTLYRHRDGEWTDLPTTVVGETEGYVIFETRSPGLSDFVIGAKKPKFEIAKTNVTPESPDVGERVNVRVRVMNLGEADGMYTVELLIDGTTVARRDVTVAANGTRQVTFDRSFSKAGQYRVAVNNRTVDTLDIGVDSTRTVTAQPTATRTAVDSPGFGSVLTFLSIIGGLLFTRRF